MPEESYRFTIGTIECVAVSDGTFTYPSDAFVANAPAERFDEELQDHNLPPREVITPYLCLLIDTGSQRVLVDTGAGFAPTNGKLLERLAVQGIRREDINAVVLTHGHADHIGATTDDAGNVAFPNARYMMWKEEWEFWTQEQPDLGPMPVDENLKHLLIEHAHTKLPPVEGHLELIERETEIVPGVHAIPAPGHTPGHMAVSISSGNEQVLHIADTILHPILVEHPDWYSRLDLLPDEAIAAKRRILDRAATDRSLVFAFHFPFPGLGRVTKAGTAWRWEPVEVSG